MDANFCKNWFCRAVHAVAASAVRFLNYLHARAKFSENLVNRSGPSQPLFFEQRVNDSSQVLASSREDPENSDGSVTIATVIRFIIGCFWLRLLVFLLSRKIVK